MVTEMVYISGSVRRNNKTLQTNPAAYPNDFNMGSAQAASVGHHWDIRDDGDILSYQLVILAWPT